MKTVLYNKVYSAPVVKVHPSAPVLNLCVSTYDSRLGTEYYEEQSEIIL